MKLYVIGMGFVDAAVLTRLVPMVDDKIRIHQRVPTNNDSLTNIFSADPVIATLEVPAGSAGALEFAACR